jgi:hypothetical protein
MGVDAVVAAMSNGDGHVQHLLGLGIERSWPHHLLDALPRAFERDRIVGECAPKVVDELGFPDGADVVENGTRLGGEFVIGVPPAVFETPD